MKLLVLPILVPLSTAAVLMLAPKRPAVQRWIGLGGACLLLASALILFLRIRISVPRKRCGTPSDRLPRVRAVTKFCQTRDSAAGAATVSLDVACL